MKVLLINGLTAPDEFRRDKKGILSLPALSDKDMTMIKRIFASVILGIILFTGENAMAETALNAGQKQ